MVWTTVVGPIRLDVGEAIEEHALLNLDIVSIKSL
jgi:hypothetical protein